ncbi:MAG: phosphoglycerate kinase [Candidatus Odinarchaeia archaeon]
MDDINVNNKRILVRVDINSPIANNHTLLDTTRIKSILPTLEELKNAQTVLLAHQSRPGKRDFTTLAPHAVALRSLIDRPVKYVDDIFGSHAIKTIKNLKKGEILLLENVRFYSEEIIEGPISKLSQTIMVKRLSPLFDYFVNDAFAAAHRSQPSLVGFTKILPTVAGRLMEKELKVLNKIMEPLRPSVFIVGGAKVKTKLKLIKNILKNGKADKVLIGGLLTNIFLKASGYNIGKINQKTIEGFNELFAEAKRILEKYSNKIEIPLDIAFEKEGKRVETEISNIPKNHLILDIGLDTIVKYSNIIVKAKTVVANGPMGAFEKEKFALGSQEILDAMTHCKDFTVVGGGELGGYANLLGLAHKIKHLSTGGGATLALLSGQELPVIKALKESAISMRKK